MIQCFSLPVEVRLCGSYLLWPTGRMTSRLLCIWGLGSSKTVVQGFSGSTETPTFLAQPVFFPCRPPALPAPLMQVSSHKWLGLRWSDSGGWMHHAMVTVAACSSMVNLLCSCIWIPIGFHLLLSSQSSLSWKWKQHWDLGVGCGGFPQRSNVFWLLHSRTGQGSFLAQSLGIMLLVVKQIWVGLLMRPTVLLLILLQCSENFGHWKVPLLVVFSVQVMFLLFPHGHPFLVNFLPAKILLTGPLGWAEGLLRLRPTSSTWTKL